MHPIVVLLITLAVVILPFVIGSYLGRRFRMPDHSWKIGIILFAFAASLLICVFRWPPKLGIDLSGGVILVYEVDKQAKTDDQTVDMDKLVDAVSKRVNPGGVKETTVRPYGVQQVEIIIPKASQSEVERIEKNISSIGSLEFRIVANPIDHQAIIDQALAENLREVRDSDGKVLARWIPVAKNKADEYRNQRYTTRTNRKGEIEVLVVMDQYNVTGQYLNNAAPGVDERGRPSVKFTFNSQGGNLFSNLTGDNLPDDRQGFERQLAIILDAYLQSSPNIQTRIYDQGQITGLDSQDEVEQIVEVLNAGSLPTALAKDPVSRLFTGPTLGADTIFSGELSMVLATGMVIIFMLVYYRFAGMVACMALLLNVLLTVAIMITIKAAFTLPGLAGLVLTVGMAVDANVLIYERMREELGRGASLKMAIRNGYDRAMAAIIDSHVTTLLSAVVLYVIGTDQIKGFAVTLFLGLLMSLFTAVFCSRVIFEIAERMRWVTSLKFMQMIRPTNIDFVRITTACLGASAVCIVIGLVFTVMRVQRGDLFDIDFTGGTSVQLEFLPEQPQKIAEIRATMEKILPDVAVSDVQISGEAPDLRFLVNTSEPEGKKVEELIASEYRGKLAYNELTFKDVKLVEARTPGTETPATPAGDDSGKQSRFLPGEDRLLAMAAQDETPATDAAPATDAPAAETPAAETPATETPAAASEPAATTQQPAQAPAATTPVPPADAPTRQSPFSGPAGAGLTKPLEAVDPFIGGVSAVLNFTQPLEHDAVIAILASHFPNDMEIDATHEEFEQGSAAANEHWQVKFTPPATLDSVKQALTEIAATLKNSPYFPATNVIGGAVAGHTQRQAIMAILASLVFMVGYIWIRFQKLTYGTAAALALVHDVLITLGALAISSYIAPFLGFALVDPFKINLPIIAAFLTIVGYSINDTIVTFDRLREIKGKSAELTPHLINQAINQTLGRTLLTSLTVFMTVVILYIWGGQGIHGFAYALVVGSIAGVYSTIFIALPIVLWMQPGTPEPANKKAASRTTAATP